MQDRRAHAPWWVRLRAVLLSAIAEKNPVKQLAVTAPIVLSMTRLIILSFTVAMLHQIWSAGIVGWPEAVFCIALVLALPLVDAFAKLNPSVVVDTFKTLLNRAGVGGTNTIGNVFEEHEWKTGDPKAGVV